MNTNLADGLKLAVKVGGKELIFSGVVHVDQTNIEIEFDGIAIEFKFLSDDGGVARYETNIEGSKRLVFHLYNHSNSLGEGVYEPIEIGNHSGRKLYLTYFVSTASRDEDKRRFEFAFYLGNAS